METQFLDTNVILRHIVQDNLDQAQRAYSLFRQVEIGTAAVTTCEAVIVEAVYVLSSNRLYSLSRPQIRSYLASILSLKGLRIPHKRTYLRALDLYATTNLDFADVLIIAHMERTKIKTVISFDRHFDRIQSIIRQEP